MPSTLQSPTLPVDFLFLEFLNADEGPRALSTKCKNLSFISIRFVPEHLRAQLKRSYGIFPPVHVSVFERHVSKSTRKCVSVIRNVPYLEDSL